MKLFMGACLFVSLAAPAMSQDIAGYTLDEWTSAALMCDSHRDLSNVLTMMRAPTFEPVWEKECQQFMKKFNGHRDEIATARDKANHEIVQKILH